MRESRVNTKSDITTWIFDTINVRVTELQELGTGVVYCQLLSHYKHKSISESLINYFPKTQHQYTTNLRLFQSALARLKCNRRIDIDKLSKMKFQDNWQTISWLRKYLQEKPEQLPNPLSVSRRFHTPIKFSLPKQPLRQTLIPNNTSCIYPSTTTPLGKSSITSTLMQNNYLTLIQRMKQVLTSQQLDSEKVKLLSILLNVRQKEKICDRSKQNQKQRQIDSQIKELIE